MDELVTRAVEEIVLEGIQGCTLTRLWELIQIPDDTKDYIFKELLELEDVNVYYNNAIFTTPVSDYQHCIVVASERLLDQSLQEVKLIGNANEARNFYSAILKSREKGISQIELSHFFQVDSKTTFHHVKRLRRLQTIHAIPWIMKHNVTKLFLHQKFLSKSEAYQDYLKTRDGYVPTQQDGGGVYISPDEVFDRLDAMLASAHNHALVKEDIFRAFGLTLRKKRKSFNQLLRRLSDLGYIALFKTRIDDTVQNCVQALQRFSAADLKAGKQSTVIQNEPIKNRIGGMTLFKSNERQVYETIVAAGTDGISRQEIMVELPFMELKVMIKILEVLSKGSSSLVSAISKLKGKVRYKVYVARNLPPPLITMQEPTEPLDLNFNFTDVGFTEPLSNTPTPGFSTPLLCKSCKKVQVTNVEAFMGCCSLACQRDLEDAKTWQKVIDSGKKMHRYPFESVRRDRVLLELIDAKRTTDVSMNLLTEFQNLLRQYHPDSQVLICDVKSLRKAVQGLVDAGKAHFFTTSIKNLNGTLKQIQIVMSNTVDVNSDEVKEFLKDFQHSWLFDNSKDSGSKYQTRDMEVHRMNIGDDQNDLDEGDAPTAQTDLMRISTYGFMRPTNAKLRELHTFLFRIGLQAENSIITLEEAFKAFPVWLALKVVWVDENPAISEFISKPENAEASFWELPVIAKTMSSRIKKVLVEGIALLVELGFVQAVKYDEGSSQYVNCEGQGQAYCIKRRIELRNYDRNPPKVTGEMDLTETSLQTMWEDLENKCLSVIDLNRSGYGEINCQDRFRFLFRTVSWKNNFSFTTEQKKALGKYVDRRTGSTPSQNRTLCVAIAKQLSIPVYRVRYFFLRIEAIYENKRKRTRSDNQDQDSGLLSSIRTKKRRTGEPKEPEELKPKKSRTQLRPRRKWSPEEDEFLLAADAVLYQYLEFGRRPSSWLVGLFPQHDFQSEHYRRRISNLKRNPDSTQKVMRFRLCWDSYKDSAAAKGISLERDDVQNNFLNVVQDFFEFINTHGSPSTNLEYFGVDLASLETKELYQRFDVVPTDGFSSTLEGFLKIYQRCFARQSKLTFMQSVSFTQTLEGPKTNTVMSLDNLNLFKAAGMLKIMLILPKEKCNASLWWNLLTSFNDSCVESAINLLCDIGTTSKNTKGSERKIPGRAYQLSSLFWERLGGPFSAKLGIQAMKFWKNISSEFQKGETVLLPNIKTDGMMAVLLEILSSHSYTISFDFDQEEEEYYKPNDLQLSRVDDVYQLSRNHSFELSHPDLTENNENTLSSISTHSGVPLEQIQILLVELSQQKELGCTLNDFIVKLSKDILFLNLAMALQLLEKAGTIHRVGYDDVRYVLEEYKAKWEINLQLDTQDIKLTPITWGSMTGNRTDSVYRMCFDSLLSHILDSPGISKDDLRERMRPVVSYFEMETLLQDMLQKGTIYERVYEKPDPMNSFLDGLFGSVEDQLLKPFDLFHATLGSYPIKKIVHVYYPSESWFRAK